MLLRIPAGWEIVRTDDIRRGDILLGQDRNPFYVKAAYAQENGEIYVLYDAEGRFTTVMSGEQLLRRVVYAEG